jgi:hypothetical protein
MTEPKGILAGALIFLIVGFLAATLYLRAAMDTQSSQLTVYQTRREDLSNQEQSLQELIVRLNATLVEDLSKEATLADIAEKASSTKALADQKSNQSPGSSTVIINKTVVNTPVQTPTVQISAPKPKPRTTRAS